MESREALKAVLIPQPTLYEEPGSRQTLFCARGPLA